MANKKIRLGILAIVLVFVPALSCAADRGGTLTITGIPAGLNGFYVAFVADDFLHLIGAENVNLNTWDITRVRISGGGATIPMWIVRDDTRLERFSGTGNVRIREGVLSVGNTRTVSAEDVFWESVQMFNEITFTNGNATIYWGFGRRIQL